jgi:quinohemoprotein ethanol dehydrogenase
MQAPTNGFFYVIDRVTGQLISADKIGKVTWAERVDLKTGRPVEAPNIRYENGPVTFWPSPWGLHNWQAMSFDPDNGLVYIPIMNMGATYSATPQDAKDAEASVLGQPNYQFPIGASFAAVKQDPEDGTGGLIAWDPVAKRRRWTVKYPTPWNGGTLVTAAKLVFWGTGDGWLHAYSAGDGQEVWKFYASNGIIAPPMTYMANGEQYIAVLVGYGGATPQFVDPGWRFGKHVPRVLAFKVNGTARLPPSPGPDLSLKPINDASLPIDAASAERGGRAFHHECFQCHGIAGEPKGSAAPDLRESAAAHSFDAFRAIVQGGALISGGMPQFDDRPDQEIQDLFMYIRQISRSAQSAPGSPAGL